MIPTIKLQIKQFGMIGKLQ